MVLVPYILLGTLGFTFGTSQPPKSRRIHQFVSFQTPPSPVISDVETLRDDDNESNYEGSDKELKMAQNILDELELPETEPFLAFTAITPVFEILLGEPPNGSVSEIRENVQTAEDEEITAIDLRRMMFFLGRIFEEIAPSPKDPK